MIGVLFLLMLGTGSAGPDESEAVEEYGVAEQAKEAALLALETAYTETEDALQSWKQREALAENPLRLVLTGRVLLIEGELDRIQNAASGASAARRARRQIQDRLEQEFRKTLQGRGLSDEGLLDCVAVATARSTAGNLGQEGLADRIAEALAPYLGDGPPFHELWNETLHQRSPEAREYRERYNAYIAAGVKLDRIRSPHRYRPGGERVRAGMVFVPGGRCELGPNTGFERKKRKIVLRPYLIDQYEVTSAEYLLFVESLSEEERARHLPRIWEPDDRGQVRPRPDQLDRPVAGVTWRQAAAYARWVGKRLPTEDEWEYACRGKDANAYPWGPEYREGHCNDAEHGAGDTVPVGQFTDGASPFQVFHMAGNVEEWTASHEDGAIITQLTSNIAPIVVRGGHYLSARDNVGGLFRWVAPGGSTREPYIGFRCAADLPSR